MPTTKGPIVVLASAALLLGSATPRMPSGSSGTPTPSPTVSCYKEYVPSPYPSYSGPVLPNPGGPSLTSAEVQAAIAQGEAEAKAEGYDISSSPGPSSSPGTCPSLQPPTGNLLQRIYQAAFNYRGTSTDHLAGDGYNSCAASLQQIVKNATGATIGDAAVATWQAMALSGQYGGTVLSPAQSASAKPGAIIIWVGHHVGVCAAAGCTTTWSNHSDHGSGSECPNGGSFFAACGPNGPIINGGINAGGSDYIIWEPQHIP
jgi:hypothetical protein